MNQTVKICSPASGSTVASPVQFSAGALDTTHPITGMVLYVDSVNKASSTSAHLTAALSIPAGKHTIVIRAWNSTRIQLRHNRNLHGNRTITYANAHANSNSYADADPSSDANASSNTNAWTYSFRHQRRKPRHLYAAGESQLRHLFRNVESLSPRPRLERGRRSARV